MHSVTAIILLAFDAHAKELAMNQTVVMQSSIDKWIDTQSSVDKAVDRWVDELVDRLCKRVLKASALQHADLDVTTLVNTRPHLRRSSPYTKPPFLFPFSPFPILRSLFPAAQSSPISDANGEHLSRRFHASSVTAAKPQAAAHVVAAQASLAASASSAEEHNDYPELSEVTAEEFLQLTEDPAHAPVVVDWEAKWCRKCKYLKPKLAKMTALFPDLRFVTVDVNKSPRSIVVGVGVKKMPTIQIWRHGQNAGEVVGEMDTPLDISLKVQKMLKESSAETQVAE